MSAAAELVARMGVLAPAPNSVVVLRDAEALLAHADTAAMLADVSTQLQVTFLVLPEGVQLHVLPEDEMERAGWVRRERMCTVVAMGDPEPAPAV